MDVSNPETRLLAVTCRLVQYDQWLVTHLDSSWTVAQVKAWLLSKCQSRHAPIEPPRYRPASPIVFEHIDHDHYASDESDEYDGQLDQPAAVIPDTQGLLDDLGEPKSPASDSFVDAPEDITESAFDDSDGEICFAVRSDVDSEELREVVAPKRHISKGSMYADPEPPSGGFLSRPSVSPLVESQATSAQSVTKPPESAEKYVLIQFSSGMMLDDHRKISDYVTPYELVELHRAPNIVHLPRHRLRSYVEPYWEGHVKVLRQVYPELNRSRGAALSDEKRKLARSQFQSFKRYLIVHRGYFKIIHKRGQTDPDTSILFPLSTLYDFRDKSSLSAEPRKGVSDSPFVMCVRFQRTAKTPQTLHHAASRNAMGGSRSRNSSMPSSPTTQAPTVKDEWTLAEALKHSWSRQDIRKGSKEAANNASNHETAKAKVKQQKSLHWVVLETEGGEAAYQSLLRVLHREAPPNVTSYFLPHDVTSREAPATNAAGGIHPTSAAGVDSILPRATGSLHVPYPEWRVALTQRAMEKAKGNVGRIYEYAAWGRVHKRSRASVIRLNEAGSGASSDAVHDSDSESVENDLLSEAEWEAWQGDIAREWKRGDPDMPTVEEPFPFLEESTGLPDRQDFEPSACVEIGGVTQTNTIDTERPHLRAARSWATDWDGELPAALGPSEEIISSRKSSPGVTFPHFAEASTSTTTANLERKPRGSSPLHAEQAGSGGGVTLTSPPKQPPESPELSPKGKGRMRSQTVAGSVLHKPQKDKGKATEDGTDGKRQTAKPALSISPPPLGLDRAFFAAVASSSQSSVTSSNPSSGLPHSSGRLRHVRSGSNLVHRSDVSRGNEEPPPLPSSPVTSTMTKLSMRLIRGMSMRTENSARGLDPSE